MRGAAGRRLRREEGDGDESEYRAEGVEDEVDATCALRQPTGDGTALDGRTVPVCGDSREPGCVGEALGAAKRQIWVWTDRRMGRHRGRTADARNRGRERRPPTMANFAYPAYPRRFSGRHQASGEPLLRPGAVWYSTAASAGNRCSGVFRSGTARRSGGVSHSCLVEAAVCLRALRLPLSARGPSSAGGLPAPRTTSSMIARRTSVREFDRPVALARASTMKPCRPRAEVH